jgi:hypothetical protein
MAQGHRYTRDELAAAVSASHSWRGVLRALGRTATSAGVQRAVRRQVEGFGIDHSHFTGQRRWSNRQLIEAAAVAHSWLEVLHHLGLSESGGNRTAVKAHARRLGIDTHHLGSTAFTPSDTQIVPEPKPEFLRTAGGNLAASWFLLRGYEVLWPLEPCRYDLAVRANGSFQRIQVKTTTFRNAGTYVVTLSNSRRAGHVVYDADEIDAFFVIDAELNVYLIPVDHVAGLTALSLRAYRAYQVAEAGRWLQNPAAT